MTDEKRETRNEVFGGGNIREQIMAPSAERLKSELGIDIPVESIPLPSAGVVYPEGSPLHMAEFVDLRAMTAREEDILTSKALIRKGTVITALIQSCMAGEFRNVNVSEMLSGDRNAIMVALRIMGYGADYHVEIQCPSCENKEKQTFDLGSLPIKRLTIQPVSPGQNAFLFKLPVTNKDVVFKFMTGQDEEEISSVQERKRKATGSSVDSLVTTRLQYCILSIDGNTDKAKIAQFIRYMPARDSLSLRKFIDNNEPGIEMKASSTCSACGSSEEVAVSLTSEFFWPSS